MNNKKIAIFDYGVGNVTSIANAINFLDYKIKITAEKSELADAHIIILPGVGAFKYAMDSINRENTRETLEYFALNQKKPIVGICLGMQILFSESEENGHHLGLNWIPGKVAKIPEVSGFPVPHVGWNQAKITPSSAGFFGPKLEKPFFYFDHSYSVQCEEKYISSKCEYGPSQIVASVRRENIAGVQFHPEKSDRSGLKLFRNIIENIDKSYEL